MAAGSHAALVTSMVLAMGVLLTSCGDGGEPEGPPPLEDAVGTTFHPMTWMTRRIVQDRIPVHCPKPRAADPTTWRPSREDYAFYQRVKLVVSNGAAFEPWVATAPLPASRMVKSADGFAAEFLTFRESVTHSHGAGGQHTHEGIDGHTWVDPVNAIAQAEAIRDGLIAAWPGQEKVFREGFVALQADLRTLEARFRELTPMALKARLLANHPAYAYVAKRFGWTIVDDLHLDPGETLSAKSRAELAVLVKPDRPNVMLWEKAPRADVVEGLQALGIRSVVFDPAESLSEADEAAGRDYLAIMNANLGRLRDSLTL